MTNASISISGIGNTHSPNDTSGTIGNPSSGIAVLYVNASESSLAGGIHPHELSSTNKENQKGGTKWIEAYMQMEEYKRAQLKRHIGTRFEAPPEPLALSGNNAARSASLAAAAPLERSGNGPSAVDYISYACRWLQTISGENISSDKKLASDAKDTIENLLGAIKRFEKNHPNLVTILLSSIKNYLDNRPEGIDSASMIEYYGNKAIHFERYTSPFSPPLENDPEKKFDHLAQLASTNMKISPEANVALTKVYAEAFKAAYPVDASTQGAMLAKIEEVIHANGGKDAKLNDSVFHLLTEGLAHEESIITDSANQFKALSLIEYTMTNMIPSRTDGTFLLQQHMHSLSESLENDSALKSKIDVLCKDISSKQIKQLLERFSQGEEISASEQIEIFEHIHSVMDKNHMTEITKLESLNKLVPVFKQLRQEDMAENLPHLTGLCDKLLVDVSFKQRGRIVENLVSGIDETTYAKTANWILDQANSLPHGEIENAGNISVRLMALFEKNLLKHGEVVRMNPSRGPGAVEHLARKVGTFLFVDMDILGLRRREEQNTATRQSTVAGLSQPVLDYLTSIDHRTTTTQQSLAVETLERLTAGEISRKNREGILTLHETIKKREEASGRPAPYLEYGIAGRLEAIADRLRNLS